MKRISEFIIEKLKISSNDTNDTELHTTVGDFLAWRFGVKDIIYLNKRDVIPSSLFLNTDGFDDAYELIDYLWKNRRKPVIMKETIEQEDGYAIVFYECVLGAFTIKFEGIIFEDEDMDGLFSLSNFVNESNMYERLKISKAPKTTKLRNFIGWYNFVKPWDVRIQNIHAIKFETDEINMSKFNHSINDLSQFLYNHLDDEIEVDDSEYIKGIIKYKFTVDGEDIVASARVNNANDPEEVFTTSSYFESLVSERLKVSSNTNNILSVDEFIKKCKFIANIQGDTDNYHIEIPKLDEYKDFHYPNYDILPVIDVTQAICAGNPSTSSLGKAYLTTVSLNIPYSGTPNFRLHYILSSYKQTKYYKIYTIILKNNDSLPEIIGEDLYEQLCIFLDEQLNKLYEE